MSRLDELISELCPDGVEFVRLGDVGAFYGGLTGKTKYDFENGNASFITYMNVYTNIEIDTSMVNRVQISEGEKQNTVRYGDVIFTGSSETLNECGMSSVVTVQPEGNLYLNSFCFGYRLHDPDILLPGFSKYLFRSEAMRAQIIRTAQGVTRFNVSKTKMKNVIIPVPPIPVQREIVRILDKFSELTKELTKELALRRKQYQYYLDKLIDRPDIPTARLGDIATLTRGGNFQKKDFVPDGKPCIHYGQIHTYYGVHADKTLTQISSELFSKCKIARPGDIVMALTSEDIEGVCKCVAWLGDEPVAVSGHTVILHHEQDAKYLSFFFRSEMFRKQKNRLAYGVKVVEVLPSKLKDIVLPLPSLEEQHRIASILDRFNTMCMSLTQGLPAEIQARKKQYAYYRDKLLTFHKKTPPENPEEL